MLLFVDDDALSGFRFGSRVSWPSRSTGAVVPHGYKAQLTGSAGILIWFMRPYFRGDANPICSIIVITHCPTARHQNPVNWLEKGGMCEPF